MSSQWLHIPLWSSVAATVIVPSEKAISASSHHNVDTHVQHQQQGQRRLRQWGAVARQQGLLLLLCCAALFVKGGQPVDKTSLPVILTCLVLPPLVVEPLFQLFRDKDANSNGDGLTNKMEGPSSTTDTANSTTTAFVDHDHEHNNSIDILQSGSSLPTSQSLSSLSSAIKNMTISSCRKLKNNGKSLRAVDLPLVLSDTNSLFASTDDISKLTLQDIAVIVRYSSQVTMDGFDRAAFLATGGQVSSSGVQVITSMDIAVSASRGPNVTLLSSTRGGDHDALYFLAVSRIIAEWRSLRLVPRGYKRYTLGVTLGRRDMIQNIAKVERAVHKWIREKVEKEAANCNGSIEHSEEEHMLPTIQSPTLAQILQHELRTQLHPNLPRLTDESGASGLLWLKRQLDYQTSMMHKSLQAGGPSKTYKTTKDAVKAAYKEVYGSFHGWATQSLFLHSINGSPDFDEVYASLAKDHVEAVIDHAEYHDDDDDDDDGLSNDRNDPSPPVPQHSRKNIPDNLQHGTADQQKNVTPTIAAMTSETIATGWCNFTNSLKRFNCFGVFNPKQPTSSAGFLVVAVDNLPPKDQSEATLDALTFKSLQILSTKATPVPERMESYISSSSDMTDDSLAATSSSSATTVARAQEEANEQQSIPMDQQIQMLSTELFQHLRRVHDMMSEFNMHDHSKV